MIFKCRSCSHEQETPQSIDLNKFDGQLACKACKTISRVKIRGHHFKRNTPITSFHALNKDIVRRMMQTAGFI